MASSTHEYKGFTIIVTDVMIPWDALIKKNGASWGNEAGKTSEEALRNAKKLIDKYAAYFQNGRTRAEQAIQNKASQVGVRVGNSNWIRPHHNISRLTHRGQTIELAQDKEKGTWSWEVSGEDGTGYRSKDEALRVATDMAESIARGWDE